MFTSVRNDPIRLEKQVESSSFPGRYALEMPGPGLDLPFMEDTQVRLQSWGANRGRDMVNLESDLIGLTRTLTRDDIEKNNYKKSEVPSQPVSCFRIQEPFVLETRASHPAWTYRSLEQNRWEEPLLNPQANLDIPFYNNIQTRILEKDHYQNPTTNYSD
jgi:hypothetical protein